MHNGFECEFYFIRHGESVSNATPGFVAAANSDTALTSKGFRQAKLLGKRLLRQGISFDRVYASTYRRAIQTARTMLEEMERPDVTIRKAAELMEQQMGDWCGVRQEEALTPATVLRIRTKCAHFVPPSGESYRMVQRRIAGWLEDEIIYNADVAKHGKPLRIAIVGHGAALRCLFHYIMGFDESFIWRTALDNCSISRFRFTHEGWMAISINDAAHVARPRPKKKKKDGQPKDGKKSRSHRSRAADSKSAHSV
jgi:broad specificity phosphatase PhoE